MKLAKIIYKIVQLIMVKMDVKLNKNLVKIMQ